MFDQIALNLDLLNRYAIRRRLTTNHHEWYFREFEQTVPNGVIWVKRPASAMIFYTEESVEEYKFNFLKTRPCEIVKILRV